MRLLYNSKALTSIFSNLIESYIVAYIKKKIKLGLSTSYCADVILMCYVALDIRVSYLILNFTSADAATTSKTTLKLYTNCQRNANLASKKPVNTI